MDGATRPNHRQLDGQIREIEEPFEVGSKEVVAPGYVGDPAEDCNCRCVSLARARWALDEDELQTLKDRAEFFGLDKTKDFEDFKEKYLKASKMAAETEEIAWPLLGNPITEKQYKDLMEYASGKGVALSGFRKYDGGVQTIRDKVDGAEMLLQKYPDVNTGRQMLTIALDSNLRSVDFAETTGRIIRINANAFRDTARLSVEYQKLTDAKWFVKGTDYRAVIYHEMGHVVANCYNIDSASIAKEILGFKTNTQVLDYCFDNLSQYSSAYKDGCEIIAECFASAFNSKEKNKFALKFVGECDKLIVKGRM